MWLTNIPVFHSDLFWVILELPQCEVNLIVCQSSLNGGKKIDVTTIALAPKEVPL